MTNRLTVQGLKNGIKERYWLKAFLWGLGISIVFFLPFIIMDSGYFLYYGDFNVQQIPFYQMIHDSIQSGNIGWSTTTDLGADIIGSYSFYMIGSPFFWITMLFPSKAVPHLMAPLLMIKFACASLAGYIFLKRYVKNKNYAVIGGILYAFSGFGIYNIFFNHFHEAMITFPLLLAAVDEFMYTRRKGVVAVAVCASCVVNYYFFAGQVVFVVLYWAVRMLTHSYKMTFKEFLQLAFEAILGFAAASFIFLPTLVTIVENPRISNSPNGWSALLYGWEQRYVHILESFFFPPDLPARPNFTPDSNAKWASVAAWLPMFGMVGVFSFFKLKKHKWLRYFLPILFLCAFVPILNSAFQLFNASYYARWFYMLTLIMSLATVMCLDDEETDFRFGLKVSFVITAVIAAAVGLMPNTTEKDGEKVTTYGLMQYPERFWVYVAISLLSLVMLTLALYLWKKRSKGFMRCISIMLTVVCVGYSAYLVGTGKMQSFYKNDYIIQYALNNGDDLKIDDIHDVRSDFYSTMDNIGMYWQIPNIQAFQSVVPGSIMEFYESVGVERSVASRPETKYYGLRSFLSCKYLFDYNGKFKDSDGTAEMPYWTYDSHQNGYDVYTNDCYIPYGFTYDEYITEKQYNNSTESNRHLLLLKAIVLTDEQAKKHSDILDKCTNVYKYEYSEEQYKKDCEDRRSLTCTDTKFDNGGFTSHITTKDSDELVFFSVPYNAGWSATVNGKPAEIEKVNVGFMAVRVPANTECEIRFNYKTPGFTLGIGITGVCVAVFIVYMVFFKPKKKEEKEQEAEQKVPLNGEEESKDEAGASKEGEKSTEQKPDKKNE